MSTTILTDEQIMACLVNLAETTKSVGIGNLYLESDAVPIGRAIEQAVLQSPEIQALRKDAERFEFLRDNAQLFSHFGEAGNSGWCVMRRDSAINRVFTYNGQELVEAIDAAMEKQP